MSHHVYTTDAYILESAPGREADKIYILFTRELGKLRASAQGVRLLKSKLRYSLQDYSRVVLSVVRGKEFWRITSARPVQNTYAEHKSDTSVLKAVARIFNLLKRLVPEEEKHEEVFEMVDEALRFLSGRIQEPAFKAESFEIIVVLRILHLLGYLRDAPEHRKFLIEPLSLALIAEVARMRKKIVSEINTSLRETQL